MELAQQELEQLLHEQRFDVERLTSSLDRTTTERTALKQQWTALTEELVESIVVLTLLIIGYYY